jgi:hypothetical protein
MNYYTTTSVYVNYASLTRMNPANAQTSAKQQASGKYHYTHGLSLVNTRTAIVSTLRFPSLRKSPAEIQSTPKKGFLQSPYFALPNLGIRVRVRVCMSMCIHVRA